MNQTISSIDAELDDIQREAFEYFLYEINPVNGLIRDRNEQNWPTSIAATGVALASYPVAVERGFITYELAIERTLTTLRFFWQSPQGPEPDATGFKGFFYHFLDFHTGRRAWECELSTVDTAFLIAGMLTAAQYFTANTPAEQEIRALSEALYRRVDWQWAQDGSETLCHGWKPESGFLAFRWQGYDEAMLLYILALGSPTHPAADDSYSAWVSSYEWKDIYGYQYLYSGSLFTHQLSHIWLDFRGIQDEYMRKKNSDYFENSRRATYVQQLYAIENPLKFVGYSACCWGITASEGPGPAIQKISGRERQFYNYIARSVPYGPDDGTIAPWAAISSLPFAPEIVLPMIQHCIHDLKLKVGKKYGFTSTFNRTFQVDDNPCGWISPWHYGINQGPVVLTTENYRTGFIWALMRHCPYLINGLKRAGFSGGYLSGKEVKNG